MGRWASLILFFQARGREEMVSGPLRVTDSRTRTDFVPLESSRIARCRPYHSRQYARRKVHDRKWIVAVQAASFRLRCLYHRCNLSPVPFPDPQRSGARGKGCLLIGMSPRRLVCIGWRWSDSLSFRTCSRRVEGWGEVLN